VGAIHGDEQIGLSVVDRLMSARLPYGVNLWLIPTVNPDGVAARTRGNAHGVDENRNFPYHWAASTPGSSTYGGPRALSEPETRGLADFLLRVRPHTVVVMHTPLDAVDYSEGADRATVQYLAARSGYPARTLGARPGELTGWYNSQAWQPSAITFEFGSAASTAQRDRVAAALVDLAVYRLTR
jgi:protein MpaA